MPKDWSDDTLLAEVEARRRQLDEDAKADADALKEKFGPRPDWAKESATAVSSGAGLSDTGRHSMQDPPELDASDEALLAEIDAMRQQQEAEARADAAALEEKFGPPLPPAADAGESDWVDRGIQDVPVADLPWPEGVNGPEDFNHHISHNDAASATKQLEEMKPQIAQGFTSEDFADQDAAAGLDYKHGRQRVYDLYYGSDSIRLARDGDNYDIVSGRHRVYVAKELGLDSIPAHVMERVKR